MFAVGPLRLSTRGEWMAAVLSCGSGALLSHRAAAALWELRGWRKAPIAVTTLDRGRRARDGVELHHAGTLVPVERAVRGGIPVTSLSRTLLDLAASDRQGFPRALEEAERLRLVDSTEIAELCARHCGRPGSTRLAAAVGGLRAATDTRSGLERRFAALCVDHGLPQPAYNVFVEGFVVDAFWPDARLVVELDGGAFHRHPTAFERDRLRDAALQVAGYRVVRFTHARIGDAPGEVAETVGALLACARPRRPTS